MTNMGIGIMCVQEAHIKECPYFESDEFLIIYSGCEENQNREYAGVGFIIAPYMKFCVKSFMQLSSRIAILKLRIKGGIATLISAYAPANTHDFEERFEFF